MILTPTQSKQKHARLTYHNKQVQLVQRRKPCHCTTMDLSKVKLGFLGAGHFAHSLIKSFIDAGTLKPNQIICSNRSQASLTKIKELGVTSVTTSHEEMVNKCDVIVICIHPKAVIDVLCSLSNCCNQPKLVISVAAGVTIAAMEEALPANFRIIRILPNLPSMVRAGASLFSPGTRATDDDNRIVKELFSAVGTCDMGKEDDIDVASVLVVPLFGYLMIESMADGAVKMGLPRNLATKMAAQSLLGSAKLLLETGKTPGQLKEEVCSPGGVTVTTLHSLEQDGIRATVMNAIEKGTLRAKRMGDK